MTTPPAPKIPVDSAEPDDASVFAAEPANSAAPTVPGWDPYEVWRTRVLVPKRNSG